jgi:hypothetical protein
MNINIAIRRQGQFILGDLIPLGEVGVEIIFSGKLTVRGNPAASGQGRAQSKLQDLLVENGQASGQARAYRAGEGVGLAPEEGGAGTENFALGQKLSMNLQADDRFIFHKVLRS